MKLEMHLPVFLVSPVVRCSFCS